MQTRRTLPPDVAAWTFGSLATLLILVAIIAFVPILRYPRLSSLAWPASILAPCVPLIYFAARGFREGRRSAFDDLPESACTAAAYLFVALAVFLGLAAGAWGTAVGPGVAAVLLAACVRSVRELVAQMSLRIALLAILGAAIAVAAFEALFWANLLSLFCLLFFQHNNAFVVFSVALACLLIPAAAIFYAMTFLPVVTARTAILFTSASFAYFEGRVTQGGWFEIGRIGLVVGVAYLSWRKVRLRLRRLA